MFGSVTACSSSQPDSPADDDGDAVNDNRSHLKGEYYSFGGQVVRLAFIFGR
jgi:hypothetical protein